MINDKMRNNDKWYDNDQMKLNCVNGRSKEFSFSFSSFSFSSFFEISSCCCEWGKDAKILWEVIWNKKEIPSSPADKHLIPSSFGWMVRDEIDDWWNKFGWSEEKVKRHIICFKDQILTFPSSPPVTNNFPFLPPNTPQSTWEEERNQFKWNINSIQSSVWEN